MAEDLPRPTPSSSSSFHSLSDPPTPSLPRWELTHLLPSPTITDAGLISYDTSPDSGMTHLLNTLPRQDLDPLLLSPRVRSCDVYIGACGRKPSLLRFVRWLRAELEMHGVSCFVSDRSRCKDAQAHAVSRAAIDAAAFGVVVVTPKSFKNPYCIEELRVFTGRKKMVPVFFGLSQAQCSAEDIVERHGGHDLWEAYGGLESEWRAAVEGLSRPNRKLEANAGNYRDCILEAVSIIGTGLGRRSVVERLRSWKESAAAAAAAAEFPFPRNAGFVGRRKELLELELMLFGDIEGEGEDGYIEIRTRRRGRRDLAAAMRGSVARSSERRKGKEPVVWKESSEEIEMQGESPVQRQGRRNGSTKLLYGKGIACVSGDSGIGKTELLLEFSHRFAQRYKMILWVGGESRYIRHNYMKLLPLLGVDWSVENELCSERNEPRTFEEMEKEAIGKVRKELMRDIPYLLVIDNLEREKDWWDRRGIFELLPRFGGATHVMISTRLPRIVNIECLRLPHLSSAEAITLMKGSSTDIKSEEAAALSVIEEKLGKLPFGLAIIRALISELPISPPRLLDAINGMPHRDFTWSRDEDSALNQNAFLVQLLDFCYSLLDRDPRKVATRMIQASRWFAPSSAPISMLALAAKGASRKNQSTQLWRKCRHMASYMCMRSSYQSSDEEASEMLVKFGIARLSNQMNHISFHDIVKLYGCKRAKDEIADSVVRAISIRGDISQHMEQIWAACFLLFKFGNNAVAVNLPINDLLSFIEHFVLPLALHSFNASSRCDVVLELLRLATEQLEEFEESNLSNVKKGDSKTFKCLTSESTMFSDPLLYQKFAHMRATLLETRAKFMLRGGLYDDGERNCQKAIIIKEVIYGDEHPETLSTREILEQLRRKHYFGYH